MIERATNPRGEHCLFDTSAHRYWIGETAENDADENTRTLGELIPVTKLIGQFYQLSPWHGMKCDVEFGNRAHKVARECLKGLHTSVSPTDDERPYFSALWKFAKKIKDFNSVEMIESILFSQSCGVAGMIDLSFVCNGQTYVCDWKTGDITLPAKCKFIAPFSHLVADPLTIYSLQCSMYQVLMDVGGYAQSAKFAPARLLWLHKGDDDVPKVDALTCRDLRREAAEMIAMRSYTPWFKDWEKRCPW